MGYSALISDASTIIEQVVEISEHNISKLSKERKFKFNHTFELVLEIYQRTNSNLNAINILFKNLYYQNQFDYPFAYLLRASLTDYIIIVFLIIKSENNPDKFEEQSKKILYDHFNHITRMSSINWDTELNDLYAGFIKENNNRVASRYGKYKSTSDMIRVIKQSQIEFKEYYSFACEEWERLSKLEHIGFFTKPIINFEIDKNLNTYLYLINHLINNIRLIMDIINTLKVGTISDFQLRRIINLWEKYLLLLENKKVVK